MLDAVQSCVPTYTQLHTCTHARTFLPQVRAISAKKKEPEWMLEFRLKAFRKWLTMDEPRWSDNSYPSFDYQGISYYSEPKIKEQKKSLDEVRTNTLTYAHTQARAHTHTYHLHVPPA